MKFKVKYKKEPNDNIYWIFWNITYMLNSSTIRYGKIIKENRINEI